MKPERKIAPTEIYALAFGLFLGLCILKFGNPVILDQKISQPTTLHEYWTDAWPIHWVNWVLLPLVAIGGVLIFTSLGTPQSRQLRLPRWLLILPLLWFGWQVVSATQTVDPILTAATLWQFFGCVACYFIGAFLLRSPRALNLLLIGILAAFTVCLIRAVQQRMEYPHDEKFLLDGQRAGWTNMPPATVEEMRRDQSIITTNGMDVVNPMLLAKLEKGRVMGTLVYPNALAGIVLLLFPVAFTLALNRTKKLRPVVRVSAIFVTVALSTAAFFWSGSKFGWLIAMFVGGVCLFRFPWPLKFKITLLALVAILGLGVFAIRFHSYFANGATSTTARFDYWKAAVQTTCSHPLLGTGPGTFQRPYEKLKDPNAEMARLAHNDYLEQCSDSGLPGGAFYTAWIITALVFIGRRVWTSKSQIAMALSLGLLGWYIQGIGEFSLFIPALAWTAFLLLGCMLGFAGANSSSSIVPESIRQKTGHD